MRTKPCVRLKEMDRPCSGRLARRGRGTSLMRNQPSLGTFRRPQRRALWGVGISYERDTPVPTCALAHTGVQRSRYDVHIGHAHKLLDAPPPHTPRLPLSLTPPPHPPFPSLSLYISLSLSLFSVECVFLSLSQTYIGRDAGRDLGEGVLRATDLISHHVCID